MKYVGVLLLVVVVAFGTLWFVNPAFAQKVNMIVNPSPCDYPIHYKIGTVDPRFGLSTDDFKTDISNAANIWDNAEGKQLFVYDPNGTLSINLDYDSRQALNNQINSMQNDLNTQKNVIAPQVQEYNQRVATFKQNVAALNQQIEYYNTHGGAPQDVYDKLTQEQKDLQTEADNLNAMAKELNQSTDNFNSEVGQLNNTVGTFNQDLAQKPEEGLYTPAENRIDIYFDNSTQELVHTLAHELGHAVGLNHNPDPKSIMYAYTNEYTTPSPEDTQALTQACARQNIFVLFAQRMELGFQNLISHVQKQ